MDDLADAQKSTQYPLSNLPFDAAQFTESLLAWYGQEGRDLPWRETRDPYLIWLAEIMLQQTTVAAVSAYYQRFLKVFPSLESLAQADQEEVINLWAGLGYYSRARNLHAAAQIIMTHYQGVFPEAVELLQQLPGIGRSTAGAISALAFERQAAILDANVRRVLCRLCVWQQAPRSSSAEKQLWRWSEQLTPAQRVHDYTQAIMDLGALVCVPRKPQCDVCPVADLCQARQLGLEQQLPLKQVKKAVPTRQKVSLLVEKSGRYLVRRRPVQGFLGGLWEFPTIDVNTDETVAEKLSLLKNDFTLTGEPVALGLVRHVYSHFHLELSVFHLCAEDLKVAESDNGWCNHKELKRLALHGAHKKVLAMLQRSGE